MTFDLHQKWDFFCNQHGITNILYQVWDQSKLQSLRSKGQKHRHTGTVTHQHTPSLCTMFNQKKKTKTPKATKLANSIKGKLNYFLDIFGNPMKSSKTFLLCFGLEHWQVTISFPAHWSMGNVHIPNDTATNLLQQVQRLRQSHMMPVHVQINTPFIAILYIFSHSLLNPFYDEFNPGFDWAMSTRYQTCHCEFPAPLIGERMIQLWRSAPAWCHFKVVTLLLFMQNIP